MVSFVKVKWETKIIRNKSGFTLIELIIVVIIIAILAAVVAPIMQNMKAKAIAAEAIQGLNTIKAALMQYYSEHNYYPSVSQDLVINHLDCVPGLDSNSLAGTYFSSNCYTLWGPWIAVYPYMTAGATRSLNNADQHSTTITIFDPNHRQGCIMMYIGTWTVQQSYIAVDLGYPGAGYY